MKKYRSFTAGVVATLMAVSTVGTALAASSRVEYNKAGISLFGENKVLTGESYKAPNGQDVPSVITYVDETGGKTNYLSIRQISELLDASVGWNAATNSVDIAAPNAGKIGEDVIVGSGKGSGKEKKCFEAGVWKRSSVALRKSTLLLLPRSSITQTIEPETLLVI